MNNKFSFDTIKNFDKHIKISIPNYDLVFESIIKLTDYFKDDEKNIYDLGCSTGKLLNNINFKGKKTGLEKNFNLLNQNKEKQKNIEIINYDLNQNYNFNNACIIISLFTIVFLKKSIRQELINNIYNGLVQGGCFIFFEKIYSSESIYQDIYTFTYYDFKKNKFSYKEIMEKERSLRSIQKPLTEKENLDILNKAGFKKIECIYRFFNFIGWLCIR